MEREDLEKQEIKKKLAGRLFAMGALKDCQKLEIELYRIFESFPAEDHTGLAEKMKNAVIAAVFNISGSLQVQDIESKVYFYLLAGNALLELKNHIVYAKGVNYMGEDDFQKTSGEISNLIVKIHRLVETRYDKLNDERNGRKVRVM